MIKKEIDALIGRSIQDANKYAKNKALKIEFYPKEAKPICNLTENLIRIWHENGIVLAWKPGNPWNVQ